MGEKRVVDRMLKISTEASLAITDGSPDCGPFCAFRTESSIYIVIVPGGKKRYHAVSEKFSNENKKSC